MDRGRKLQLLAEASRVFTPEAPVHDLALFAGRMEQILQLFGVLGQRGQHAVIYGERGVGKTSLANILGDSFAEKHKAHVNSVRVNCTTSDNFRTLWKSIFRRMQEPVEEHEISPDRIMEFLESRDDHPLIIIDEIDRFGDDDGLSLMADMIKSLSDHAVPTTVVLVGVANSIAQLVGDHRSMERALLQVQMPRMSPRELREIIELGLPRLGMSIDADALERIPKLSEGLPSYTHLLARHAVVRAIQDDRPNVVMDDVDNATKEAIGKAQQSILSDYAKAVRSPRKDNLFAEVLLACALARKNELGFFSPGSVREPLARILGRSVPISSFVRHLNEFTGDGHGEVLQVDGQPRRYFYRFTNPMLQPYVILRGLSEGKLTEATLDELRGESMDEARPDD